MKISVLVAVGRSAGNLAPTLASIGSQDHADWELIVVGARPPDGTAELVRQFGHSAGRPVHYEPETEPPGIVSARNRLLQLAIGDAIAFHEPGDVWTPHHLANARQHIEGGADVVISDLRPLARPPHPGISDITPPAALITNPVRTLFTRDPLPAISAIVIRARAAVSIGSFDTRFRSGEGRDYWLRCALAGNKFAATHRATCRTAPLSGDPALRTLLAAENAVEFYEKYRDLAAVPAALRRRLLAASLVTCGRLLRKSDPNRAARCFWRAWSLQPVHVQTLGQFALSSWRSTAPGEPSGVG